LLEIGGSNTGSCAEEAPFDRGRGCDRRSSHHIGAAVPNNVLCGQSLPFGFHCLAGERRENSQENPVLTLGYGEEKYGPAGLLASSADRGWSGLSAELRSHNGGVIPCKNTQPGIEICVDVSGSRSVITRQGGGIIDRTVTERGTIWLSPTGLQEGFVDISDPVPGILHIYLPPNRFSPNSLGIDLNKSVVESLRYESAFRDPLLAEIAYAILSELQTQTSAGGLLAETLASSLAARLVQHHASLSSPGSRFGTTRERLDRRRLARVLDYIEANLESDLTVDHLASIACLSRFHFARAFKAVVGQSPHRYVSGRRLERAKALLVRGDQSLVDIALALNFSCQANFARAFRQVTGQAPGQYRRRFSV
jgi:AraC family transcriptional regulator